MKNSICFPIGGHATPVPPPATDLSNVPPAGPSLTSYQDSKPANAWNDPPTVMMKASRPNPVKVNFILIILSNNSCEYLFLVSCTFYRWFYY